MDRLDEKLQELFSQEEKVPEGFEKAMRNALKGGVSMEKKKNKKWVKLLGAVAMVCIVGLTVPSINAKIKWNIEYKEFENREVAYTFGTVKEAIDNGYEENIAMEYVYQDGIGVKIDSLMITDDFFSMDVNFKFDENMEINTETFAFGCAVYDDEKNVYAISERIKPNQKVLNYHKKFYKEENITYDKNDIYKMHLADSFGQGIRKSTKENIIAHTTMTSSVGFPKSKKLYIRIFDIGYVMRDVDMETRKINAEEDFVISNADWKLEIEVPEKFYERETISYHLAEEIEGLELNKLEVSDTGTNMNIKMDGLIDMIMAGKDMAAEEFTNARHETLSLSDEKGNFYYADKKMGTDGKGGINASFEIGKNNLPEKLYLNIKMHNQKYTIELIKD